MDYIYANLIPDEIENFVPENIRKGVTITIGNISVTGTLEPKDDFIEESQENTNN